MDDRKRSAFQVITLPCTHASFVPIASPTHVYGCLALRNKLGTDGFSDRDEEVAVTLATHAGIAYENARLYDDLRQRSAALELEVANRRHAEERTQLAHPWDRRPSCSSRMKKPFDF